MDGLDGWEDGVDAGAEGGVADGVEGGAGGAEGDWQAPIDAISRETAMAFR